MSHDDANASHSPSRRTVVKGAAWTMPAVLVAAPAPVVAASVAPLTFSGSACKLPGGSSDTYKGYVFELVATSAGGSDNTVTVITGVTVDGIAEPHYAVSVKSGSCTCSSCGSAPTNHQWCTQSGAGTQRVLLYTDGAASGTSSNSEVCVTYTRYRCDCSPVVGSQPVTICSGRRSTPPITGGGGACRISDVFPLPA
ncbi:hypothetical protein ASH01_06675 [Terrabacter sp. Soil811]|uniref:hypothetical protein n=1 Tax=Terrabacter sp. Soil811 TaxID=1736419 RepID=UPI0006F20E75|nr:hypothetical protein [Terrabacter sp. Soil811]KRF45506.1 hypothetical protein ASH01_06675 [Terrabacter sp. Soil811]